MIVFLQETGSVRLKRGQEELSSVAAQGGLPFANSFLF